MTFFSFFSRPKITGHDTVWVNTKDNKVPIIDGKVTFYDENIGARYSLYVTQIKGKGTADADELKVLSEKHTQVLNTLLKRFSYQQYWTTDEVLGKIKFDLLSEFEETIPHEIGFSFKPNNWRRTISELFRKGIILKSGTSFPPRYTLDLAKAETARNTGKFES